jgi:hypothetical protein
MLIIEACQLTPVVLLLLRNLQTEGDTEMKLKLCIQGTLQINATAAVHGVDASSLAASIIWSIIIKN